MKYILTIEASTATQSAALMHDGELLSETEFESGRGASRDIFQAISEMLQSNNISLRDIDTFAVGLGPGNFTGLRTSLAAVEAMALPSKAALIGISSAENCAFTAAEALANNTTELSITVVGDARRKRLWIGSFSFNGQQAIPKRQSDFQLIPLDDIQQHIGNNDIVITPDWQTIGSQLAELLPPQNLPIQESILPTAKKTAHLAHLRVTAGIPGEPLNPLYMHPPVFVEPRFTESAKRRL